MLVTWFASMCLPRVCVCVTGLTESHSVRVCVCVVFAVDDDDDHRADAVRPVRRLQLTRSGESCESSC